jgi:hypothetical protein
MPRADELKESDLLKLKLLIPRENHDSAEKIDPWQNCWGGGAVSHSIGVTCNFPGCIASNLPLNLYFCEAMRLVVKVGVSLLSLLLFAAPIMACALPAMAMSSEERQCCKRMAQECGNMGMGKSHSCCQTVSVPDHLPAIKSSSDVGSMHLTLALVHAVHPLPTMATIPESGSSPWAADIHSPPDSPPARISVLRI